MFKSDTIKTAQDVSKPQLETINCYDALRTEVLDWLKTLKIPNSCCKYRFSLFSDSTIFCSCFALFILDLFRETEEFTDQERQNWISYIQSFRNEKHGYFEPEQYYHKDKERNRYQLTCFCLSALEILNAEPKIPLRFIRRWKTPEDVREYLYQQGCHRGIPGSGNKAMFLAIFLTCEYERTGEKKLLGKINAWFEFHNQTQNSYGLWGTNRRSHFFLDLQNGFHQLLVYFYWQRAISKLDRVVDVALNIQDKQGYFSPTSGGEACHDYDAIHILINAYNMLDYRREEIVKSLDRAFYAILACQNGDGGFCQSKQKLDNFGDLFKYLPFYFCGCVPVIWYERLRSSAGVVFRKKNNIITGWTKKGRNWNESNLWDTWFRSLSLAEIANAIKLKNSLGLEKVNFHRMIGLGFFNK